MARIWREISGFEPYQVSNDGLVRRRGKFISPTKTASGKDRVCLYVHGYGFWRTVSVLVRNEFGFKPETIFGVSGDQVRKVKEMEKEGQLGTVFNKPLYDMYPGKKAYEIIAESYGVPVEVIYAIRHEKRWKKFWLKHHTK